LKKCTAITRGGNRCKGIAIDDKGYCHAHHPDRAQARSRAAQKGDKRGGRGRPSTELQRLQHRFEELADQVLDGEIDARTGSISGQLLNYARACVTNLLVAREQEELIQRLEALEKALEERKHYPHGA
jgi:hypothetical protein